MAKMLRSGHKEVAQNEEKRSFNEAWRDEKLARKPPLRSHIPPRASAHPSTIAIVQPKYTRHATELERATHIDVTRLPTLPKRLATVEATLKDRLTSITSINAEISRRRTDDLLTNNIFHNIEGIVSIDEIDTLPPEVQARLRPRVSRLKRADYELPVPAEVDTWPELPIQSEQEKVSEEKVELAVRLPVRGFFIRRVFDNIRWWLLHPGRLEFLLWLIGIIVLICVTGLFVLATTASLGLFGFAGTQSSMNSDTATQKSPCTVSSAGTITNKNGKECLSIIASSSSGLKVIMMNSAVVASDTTLEIQGNGFSAHGVIDITHDGGHPCEPGAIQANGDGEFTMTITLVDSAEWLPGSHEITLYDVQSHHSITLPIMLTSAP